MWVNNQAKSWFCTNKNYETFSGTEETFSDDQCNFVSYTQFKKFFICLYKSLGEN